MTPQTIKDSLWSYLAPIVDLLDDPTISEIMINPNGSVFIERYGIMAYVKGREISQAVLYAALVRVARSQGMEFGQQTPILECRLPGGARVAAMCAPVSVGGISFTIRKFHKHLSNLQALVENKTLERWQQTWLVDAILRNHKGGILISGGTGSGKTTLLNALAAEVAHSERIALVEDTAELDIPHPNMIRFEAQIDPPITIRRLIRACMRHRPDRLIVGEVRGGEALDLLQAMNSGHEGSFCTIHANDPEQALRKLAQYAMESGEVSEASAIRQIAHAIHAVVQIVRGEGGRRKVTSIVRVRPRSDDTFTFEEITHV